MKIIDKETELRIHGHDPLGPILKPSSKIIDFGTFIENLEIDKTVINKAFTKNQSDGKVKANKYLINASIILPKVIKSIKNIVLSFFSRFNISLIIIY